MVARVRRRAAIVFIVATLSGALSVAEGAEQGAIDDRSIEQPAPDRPDRGGAGAGLAAAVAAAGSAGFDDGVVGDGTIVVEIVHDDLARVEARVAGYGGSVRGTVAGLTLAAIPLDRLPEVEADDGLVVRIPVRVDIPQSPQHAPSGPVRVAANRNLGLHGGHVGRTNADDWHAAGLTGRGVRIGIIDAFDGALWSAAVSAGELPDPAGTLGCSFGWCSTGFPESGLAHGVAVAEVVHEMAPDAELFLASAYTAIDVKLVIDWFAAMGVEVVSRSLTAPFDGPGDGTGPLASIVDYAVARGMVWFNSAGNNAGRGGLAGGYYREVFTDLDGDDWHDFDKGSEVLEWRGCGLLNGLRWDDWSGELTDYDVYIFDSLADLPSMSWEARIVEEQTGRRSPIELMSNAEFAVPGDQQCDGWDDVDYIAVHRRSGDDGDGDVLELMVNSGSFDQWDNPHSASGPVSDTASGGAVIVGAQEPLGGTTIAAYSSEGPTNDGRVKPDLTAASCVAGYVATVRSFGCQDGVTTGFSGTSAATPVAAGAAALVIDSGAASTPFAVRSYLLDAAVDRGLPGIDNVFGHGELILPPPPVVFMDIHGSVFEADIGWLAATGITKGCNPPVNDRFCPRAVVTRGQMAAFLVRALGLVAGAGADLFVDDDTSVFAADIDALATAGITKGCNPPVNDRFCPSAVMTRGQMAAFLHRALEP